MNSQALLLNMKRGLCHIALAMKMLCYNTV